MKPHFLLLNLSIFCLLTGCEREKAPPPLEIDRTYHRIEIPTLSVPILPSSLEPDDGGRITFSIRIAPWLVRSMQTSFFSNGNTGAADPFAPEPSSANQEPIRVLSLLEVFETAGIQLVEPDSVSYDHETFEMRFVAEPYKAELIAAFFSSFKIDTSKRVFVEIEEFDMKTELASQLLNSSEREGNHQPERSAAIDLVRNGKATYRGHSILSRSGIRSSIQTFKSGRKATPIVADPVLGADNVTIDLVVESGGIRSQVSIHDRLPTLLGIQKRDDDISSVCFVTGTIQPLSIHYVSTEKRNPKADTEFGKKVTIQKSAESSLPPFQVSRQFRKAQPPFYRISQNGKLQLVNQRPQTFYYRVPPWVFNDWCEIIDSRSDEKKVDSSTNEAQTFFESKGIVFTKGTSASYDSDSSLLQITQTAKELAAIDAYFTNMGYQTEKQIMVRLETYRVHPGHAIQLLESARSESNHQPERDAIRKAAEQGHAELVDFQSHTLNGAHRASFGIPEDQKTDEVKKNPSPHFLVDAVLGADTHSVDAQLSYYLERQINELKTGHQIETLLTLNKGDYAIVGNWCNKDGSHTFVFISAKIHTVGEIFTRLEKNPEAAPKSP